MGVNNINSPVFANKATEISKSDTIDSTKFLDGAVIYVGSAGDLNVIVAGEKREGQVVNTTITEGGTGYTTPVTGGATSGGRGSGLTVTTTVSGGAVATVTVVAAGTGYKKGDIITVDGGNDDATFTVDSISNLPTLADAVEFSGMQAGTTLKVFVDYVLSTDTTAGGLVSLK